MNRIARFALVGLLALLAAVALAQMPPAASARAATFQSVEEGAQIYASNCAACHQANGEGIAGAFPPLADNPRVADVAYVESVVREGLSGPIEVLGVSYDSTMPAVALSDDEVSAVVAYVTTFAGSEPSTPTTATTATSPSAEEPIAGDPDRGHDLFVGSASFANGGPACAACHAAGTVDGLGGPGLGPDLTVAFDRLGGEAGLTGWLANPPSPVMIPLFVDKSLADDEIADVVAYLGEARNAPPGSKVDLMTLIGLAGAAILFGGLAIASRGLRRTYVERLRSKP